jgi:FtsP/CotA-like multicopper oxidase with cupredoxin domain
VIQQPPALFSQNGVLIVRFSWQTTIDSDGRTLYCFMTPDGLENPTLHIIPGDHLIITLTNNTPALGFMMTLDPPLCGPAGSQMTFSSINIHYHGTNTSPTCHQDEVIKTLVNSGQTFQYNVAFPKNEPSGLYWYHPHVHGIAEKSVLGGGAGAIVIDGIQNLQPIVSGLHQRILVVRDQPTAQFQEDMLDEGTGGDPNGIPFQDVTINNITTNTMTDTTKNPPVTTYTPAILHMQPGEMQFWRVCNCSADTILDLQVQFDGVPQPFRVVAADGVPVNSQDGTQPGSAITLTHFRLPMASRVEFIVKAPSPTVRLAQLVTLNIPTGADGDDDPNRPLFDIQLSAQDDDQSAQDDTVPQTTAMSATQKRFSGMGSAPIAVHRTLYFNENEENFFMDVVGVPEHVFDPNAPPAITATQGTVEEWVVQNRTQENHEFHVHQTHFLVESQNNFAINQDAPAPGVVGQYLDTVDVPAWDGKPKHPYPSVTLRIDFRGPDVGDFVFHCHILEHEDGGMMQIIRVLPQNSSAAGHPPGPPNPPGPPPPPGTPPAGPPSPPPGGSGPPGTASAPPSPGGMANMPGMGHMNLK